MAPTRKPGRKETDGGKSPKPKKKVVLNSSRPEIEFCLSITTEAPLNNVQKVLGYALGHLNKKDEELFVAACQAVERLCAPDADAIGVFILLEAEALECFHYIAGEGNKDARHHADTCVKAFYDRIEVWLDEVDAIDFTELPRVLDLGKKLAALDEDVALSLLGAMERFANHRLNNCVTMLENGVLQIFHLILSVHRSPECCHELLSVMYRVLDIPGEPWVQPLLDEKELILSVVETMNHAPLNMRMQLAGLRLLCLWNQPERYDPEKDYAELEDAVFAKDKLRLAMQEAGAAEALQRALTDLRNGGLHHQAAWLNCVAGGAVSMEGLAPRIDELADWYAEMSGKPVKATTS
eukprot:TRINITY_DN112612_c0_g1_i1.p1 TRINITY_DN112612_c0_g1~~TRINITY_DN112612_c0_g1_i1.p1  ORF type:complete len:352 (+),score=87.16 TRINITY_DN112612_c0_g1_i1:63-1118(+)